MLSSIITSVKSEPLQKKIWSTFGFGSTVYTDGWTGYVASRLDEYVTRRVNHVKEYVRLATSTTPGIENFWHC